MLRLLEVIVAFSAFITATVSVVLCIFWLFEKLQGNNSGFLRTWVCRMGGLFLALVVELNILSAFLYALDQYLPPERY